MRLFYCIANVYARHDFCMTKMSKKVQISIERDTIEMSHQGADEKRLSETLSIIKRKYVILSGKGGVGKSTIAVNLAVDRR